jgi:hypothetical protein
MHPAQATKGVTKQTTVFKHATTDSTTKQTSQFKGKYHIIPKQVFSTFLIFQKNSTVKISRNSLLMFVDWQMNKPQGFLILIHSHSQIFVLQLHVINKSVL